ncbi:MAG: inorganic diphosphatase [Pseudomonadota bacterium]|nr:inorganic diphosphatase [Pseudomonadota bacterium]
MSLSSIPSGAKVPDEFNVVIEIPAHSDPVKYEVDKLTAALFVDRFLSAPMFYPCNYGYIPQTLCGDGDPLDVLVVTPHALLTGSVIRARAVGVLKMTDESGEDAKLLAVPVPKLTPIYDQVQEVDDLPPQLVAQIQHFFSHYKDLETGKWVRIDGWGDSAEARKEVLQSIDRYTDAL